MIYGARVRHARLFLGETQTRFADKVGLVQSQISAIERSSTSEVHDEVLFAMAERTGFPPRFFELEPSNPIEEVQFRARLTAKASDRNRAVTCADIVHESFVRMHGALADTVPLRFPRMVGSTPQEAANEFRSALSLPYGPIPNLTLPAERTGLVVLALPIVGVKHDAFSWWQRVPEHPVVATLAGVPGDRLRWTLAHEIGHLLLHGSESGREVERAADTFAAELLTPKEFMWEEIPYRPKLSALYAMKLRWGVSVQSLIRRANGLGRLADDQYMSLFRQVSARGERMNERFQIEREKPRLYRRMAEVLFGDPPVQGLSQLCSWSDEFAQDVLEQFASKSELPKRRVLVARQQGDGAKIIPFRR